MCLFTPCIGMREFSREVQGICSHIIDFLLEKTTEEMHWMRWSLTVCSSSTFFFPQDPIYSLLSVSEFSTGLFTPGRVLGKLHDLAWRPQDGKWGLLASPCHAVLGPALCSRDIPGLLQYLYMGQLGISLSPWHWVFYSTYSQFPSATSPQGSKTLCNLIKRVLMTLFKMSISPVQHNGKTMANNY